MTRQILGCLAAVLLMVGAGGGQAEAVTFTASSGDLAASATFTVDGSGNLVIVLTNTSTADVLIPADILTALFFDIDGVGALTPTSAALSGGSTVLFGPDGAGNVGGEWAYASGIDGVGDATEGVSSAGFGLFGDANFGGLNLEGPTGVDGLNYGILSAGDDNTTGNEPVTGGVPLIKNQVTFILDGLPDGFTQADLDAALANVSFQYGTSLSEPNISVPEPSTLVLLGAGLVAFGVWGRRQLRRKD